MTDPGRVAVVVLAAGAGSRFGGRKLLARLAERPILEHVLAAVRAIEPAVTVVVLGHDADELERTVGWATERRVRNPDPDAGLAGSLRVGLAALADLRATDRLDGAFVVLGDQPRLDPAVLRALLAADVPADRAFVVPRYVGGGGGNPVLVLRAGFGLVDEVHGDRGLGPLLARRPELVTTVELGGSNPDVDTPADLAELAWADRVRRNREQVDRRREVPDAPDFYGPVTGLFRADPRRTDDQTLDALLALARPGDTWLDIGAGAGRYALPLALHVREVVAVEPSEGMRATLAELMAEHGIANVRPVADRWPPTPGSPADELTGDVALIAHLGYDIEAIGSFLDAMEGAAGRTCAAVLMDRQPSSIADPFWPPIHGEERVALPALAEFVELLRARGRRPRVRRAVRPPRGFDTRDELHAFIRRQLWLAERGAADRRLGALVAERSALRDGRWTVATAQGSAVGLVVWAPDAGRRGPAHGRSRRIR